MGYKWKIQDIWHLLKDCVSAILQGQLLLRLDVGRFLIHIVFTFFLFGLLIWTSLRIDTTMTRMENNKKELKELEIKHANMEFELRSLNRRTVIQDLLKEQGSKVKEAEKPATVLK